MKTENPGAGRYAAAEQWVCQNRGLPAEVVSHDSNSIASTPIDSSGSIELLSSDIDVVGIDEAQFFDNGIVDVCRRLANQGVIDCFKEIQINHDD